MIEYMHKIEIAQRGSYLYTFIMVGVIGKLYILGALISKLGGVRKMVLCSEGALNKELYKPHNWNPFAVWCILVSRDCAILNKLKLSCPYKRYSNARYRSNFYILKLCTKGRGKAKETCSDQCNQSNSMTNVNFSNEHTV